MESSFLPVFARFRSQCPRMFLPPNKHLGALIMSGVQFPVLQRMCTSHMYLDCAWTVRGLTDHDF